MRQWELSCDLKQVFFFIFCKKQSTKPLVRLRREMDVRCWLWKKKPVASQSRYTGSERLGLSIVSWKRLEKLENATVSHRFGLHPTAKWVIRVIYWGTILSRARKNMDTNLCYGIITFSCTVFLRFRFCRQTLGHYFVINLTADPQQSNHFWLLLFMFRWTA